MDFSDFVSHHKSYMGIQHGTVDMDVCDGQWRSYKYIPIVESVCAAVATNIFRILDSRVDRLGIYGFATATHRFDNDFVVFNVF